VATARRNVHSDGVDRKTNAQIRTAMRPPLRAVQRNTMHRVPKAQFKSHAIQVYYWDQLKHHTALGHTSDRLVDATDEPAAIYSVVDVWSDPISSSVTVCWAETATDKKSSTRAWRRRAETYTQMVSIEKRTRRSGLHCAHRCELYRATQCTKSLRHDHSRTRYRCNSTGASCRTTLHWAIRAIDLWTPQTSQHPYTVSTTCGPILHQAA
jgi:hypothetical protein